MREDGWRKIVNGLTTFEEIIRQTHMDIDLEALEIPQEAGPEASGLPPGSRSGGRVRVGVLGEVAGREYVTSDDPTAHRLSSQPARTAAASSEASTSKAT